MMVSNGELLTDIHGSCRKDRLSQRRRLLSVCLIGLLVVIGFETTCAAQGFRVYTRVFSVAEDALPPVVIARSVSLFHAGKVYDYIDTVGEITIFEPALRRFTIVDGGRMMATTVEFSQIEGLLERAEQQAKRYATRLAQDAELGKSAESLQFQTQPVFRQLYEAEKKRLNLTSNLFRYVVDCDDREESRQFVEPYLRYADWMARLNSVMHPHTLLPGPRLVLNDALKQRKLIPVQVDLQVEFDKRLHLRAVHKIHWDLDTKDRSDIHHWESMLRDSQMRFVPFAEYRQVVLTKQVKNNR